MKLRSKSVGTLAAVGALACGCGGGADAGSGPANETPVAPGTGTTPTDPGSGVAVDPDTGLPIDPGTGLPIDPATGLPTDGASPAVPGSLPFTPAPAADAALPARTWRLTHAQYARSVQDLVGVPVSTENFAPELDSGVFRNLSDVGFVRVELADDYVEAATTLTDGLTAAQLQALIPCGDIDEQCATDFIEQMASRAFRRPATADDIARYQDLFDTATAALDADFGYRSVLRALLSSPYFLYRNEIGAPGTELESEFQLTDHEVASFLSYSLTGGPPNEALLAAAAAGQLSDLSTLPAMAQSLLAEPGAAEELREFMIEWLEVDDFAAVEKFEDTYPGFNVNKDSITQETQAFLDLNGGFDGTLVSLLTGSVPSMGQALDAFYQGDPTSLGTETRSGLLNLGAVLSTHAKPNLTSPTLRGLFVRRRVLCQTITIPPGLVIPPLEETQAVAMPQTTRELYELHATQPICAGCHALTDGIGFMLEGLDGAGRYRTAENGFAVDTVSTLIQTDVNGTFSNTTQLQQALSQSDHARECMAVQGFRYYFGQEEPARGIPPITSGYSAMAQSGTLRDLVVALTSTASTLERTRN